MSTKILSPRIALRCFFLLIPLFNGYGQRIDFIYDDFFDIPGDTVAEKKIIELVNQERVKAGLNNVTFDRALQSAARQHAGEMLRLNYFSHTSPVKGLKDPGDRVYHAGLTDFAVGENIALHSLNGISEEIAEKFMEQWMNSPGHKANILKPEFNTLGTGVISFIDSVVLDTIIRGQKQRSIIITVKHYGAQVFADRDLQFSELYLEKRNSLVFYAEIRFQIDRDILVRVGNFSDVSTPGGYDKSDTHLKQNSKTNPIILDGNNYYLMHKPEGSGNTVRLMIPYEKPVSVFFSMMWNASANTYANLLSSQIDYLNRDILNKDLSRLPVRIKKKKLFYEQSDVWFLNGTANVITKDKAAHGMVQITDYEYFEIPLSGNTLRFSIPVFSRSKQNTFRFGLSDGRETAIKHQLKINSKELNKLKPKNTEKNNMRNIIFIR